MRSLIKGNNGKYVVYMPDSLRFFQANEVTIKIIKMLESGMTVKEIVKLGIQADTEFVSNLSVLLNEKSNINNGFPEEILPRLVINISNNCNLGCRYCYANGGSYHSEPRIMSKALLKEILDKFYSIYRTIGVIQLFGGEPMLNPEAIKYVCDYVETFGKKTEIGMVTNGTILSDEIVRVIKEKNVFVTVSIDEKNVHDLLRPFKNGDKSFDIIKKNIEKLNETAGQPRQLEVTYTKIHADSGMSIEKVINALHSEVGNIPVHIAPVCTSDEKYWMDSSKVFQNSIKDYFNCLGTEDEFKYSFVEAFLYPLKEREASEGICSAGIGTMAVSVDGLIYPCFYFIDQKEFEIGSIYENAMLLADKLKNTRKKYEQGRKNKLSQCKNCYANTLCFGCLGVNNSENGDCYKTSQWRCKMMRESLNETLKCLMTRRETNGEVSKAD